MKFQHFFMSAAMLVALAACSDDANIIVDEEPEANSYVVASIETLVGSRASIDQGKVNWTRGDAIGVLLNGGSYGKLTLDPKDHGSATGTFKGMILGTIANNYHAYYPYEVAASASSVNLPASYDNGDDMSNSHVAMKATISDGALLFKHLCSVLRFQCKDVPEGASQFVFTVLDGQSIAGEFNIATDSDNNEYVAAASGINSSVTVNFTSLDEKSDIEVLVPVPVGTYTHFSIAFKNSDGEDVIEPGVFDSAAFSTHRAVITNIPVTCVEITAGTPQSDPAGTKITDGVFQTAENEYTITNANGLQWVSTQNNTVDHRFEGITIKLDRDINMAGVDWTPIGYGPTYGQEFNGKFDGNGKTISNLTVGATASRAAGSISAAGLFGYVSAESYGFNTGAYIKDVIIEGANIKSNHYAGAVAAWVQGGYLIENCVVKNSTITSEVEWTGSKYDNGDKVGGVVGYMAQNGTTVTRCSVENTTIKGYRDLGGVVGIVNSPTDGTASFTNNSVGANVKVIQDFANSYKNVPSKVSVGSIYGTATATAVLQDNAGSADITVKVYDTHTAQLALDAATTGRTIEFAAGTYDNIVIRHTKVTTQITDASGNASTSSNYYHRSLENITIKAAEGANVSVDGITINSGHTYTSDQNNPAINYVVNEEGQPITGHTNYNYFGYFYIRGLVIDGFTLNKNVYIGADSSQETNRYFDADGITLQNCQMIGTNDTKTTDNGSKLIRVGGPNNILNPLRIKNVVVRNCMAKQVFQGVYAYGPVDITVENCEFDDLGHNVLQVGAGKVTFQNNEIKNCNTDRVFRITSQNYPDNDWVKIINNTLTNTRGDTADADYPIIKIGDGAGTCNVTFSGNTMDGQSWSPISSN